MTEADLRQHLAKQTKKQTALFDLLKFSLPEKEFRTAFRQLLAEKPDVVLFDAMTAEHLARIGAVLEAAAKQSSPLFSIGSSGIEAALAWPWCLVGKRCRASRPTSRSALPLC